MTRALRQPRVQGILATALNFPIVLVGLLMILRGTDGADEVAYLNLWAIWGVANTLLGQIGLTSGSLTRASWRGGPALTRSMVAGALTAAVTGVLAGTLFPGHEWWWLGAGCVAGAVHSIGWQRGLMANGDRGVETVVVTFVENCFRTGLVAYVLFRGGDSALPFGVVAVVAPFALSLNLLDRRLTQFASGPAVASPPPPIWPGVLAGLPGLTAYALVPGLTLLGTIDDLGAIAFAGSLLRGPLLVAIVASAWLLQALRTLDRTTAPLIGVPVAAAVGQVVLEAVAAPGLVPGLIVHSVLAAAALLAGYTIVLANTAELAALTVAPLIAAGAAAAFAATLWLSRESEIVHPFVALTAATVVLAVATSSATSTRRKGVIG